MGKFKLNGDESLLQLTVNFHGDINIMTQLASLCPNLLLLQRQGEYEGQTVLHTAISKQNLNVAQAILAHPALKNPWFLLHAKVEFHTNSKSIIPMVTSLCLGRVLYQQEAIVT